jgi:hypothetical protein
MERRDQDRAAPYLQSLSKLHSLSATIPRRAASIAADRAALTAFAQQNFVARATDPGTATRRCG